MKWCRENEDNSQVHDEEAHDEEAHDEEALQDETKIR